MRGFQFTWFGIVISIVRWNSTLLVFDKQMSGFLWRDRRTCPISIRYHYYRIVIGNRGGASLRTLVRLNLQNNSQPPSPSTSQPLSPSASQPLSLPVPQPPSLPVPQPPSPSASQSLSLPASHSLNAIVLKEIVPKLFPSTMKLSQSWWGSSLINSF